MAVTAIREGVSTKNSIHDSNADISEQGKASSFMAFWSTTYDPRWKDRVYTSCVLVTGVTLTVAETVAEWTSTTEKYVVATEPCWCGPFSCDRCPVLETRTVRWPVLERRALSLKKQDELRCWMISQAIKSAEHLVMGESDTPEVSDGNGINKTIWYPLGWGWPYPTVMRTDANGPDGTNIDGKEQESDINTDGEL